jgi:PAS domain S-box-containing protein
LHDRLEWSDETLRIFGTSRDKFGGTLADFLAFVHPDDLEAMQTMHTRSLASDGIVEMEYRILRPDGEERLLYDRGETTYDGNGKPIRKTGMVLDVTERKRSEAERDRLFNLSLDLLCVAGFNGQLKQVNPAWTKCLGWTAEELTSRPMQEFILPEDREATILSRAQIHQGKPSRGFENRYRCKDGSYRWLSWNVHPSIESRQVFAVARDVTEKKRTEMSLRESEERFRQLAENINEVFWITDPGKNEMLYISPAYEKIWGRSCESLYASPIAWFEAIHSEDRGRIRQAALMNQIRGEYDETYRIMRPDGAVRWIRDRAFPVENANGEVFRIVGTAEDITARKLAEERLTEQATLLDSAHEAILVKDLEDKIIYWNKGAERTYGWTADEVLGRKSGELLYKDSTKLHECVSLLLEKGEWHGEVVKLTKDGRDLIIEVRWTLVRDAQGRPKSILAINTDITEKKKLEAHFLRAQRMDSIGTLASGIAHDLNNVLAPIIMSVATLKHLARNEDDLAVLETLSGSAQRGAQLVKQVLTFARGIEGQRIPVNPHHLMRDLLKVMRDTFPKSIDMHFTSARNLWTVTGDPTQMHQVFLNLCVNARDAMPGGGNLTITMENVLLDETYAAMNPDSRTGSFVMVQVADTGIGIPPEIQDRVFEPFFTTKEIGKGTGLGLSTTLAIVKSHGGFINLHSEVRKGTKFKVYLPANATESAADEVALEQTRLPRGAGELILVVDDEEAIRKIARRTLERFGYRVMLAVNGAEAVAIYAQNEANVAAVLTDMAMPIMDGPALILALKALNSQVRIIGSSGLASNELVARALGAGVQHFVPKPYTAEALLTTLKKVLAA